MNCPEKEDGTFPMLAKIILAMKKLFLPLFVYAFTLFSLQSCDSIDEDLEPRGIGTHVFDMDNFDHLEMGNAFQVNVKAGNFFLISATGELNDLDDLEIFVEDKELIVRYKEPWRNRRRKMTIDITMPALSGVDFSGAVQANISGFENAREIDFELSGASKCDFAGSVKTIELDLSGASHLHLIGSGQFIDGELSGASEINGFDYQSEESDIKLSGASQGKLSVTRYLKVDVSGASSLRYKGNPDVNKKVSGGSSVKKA